MNKELMFKVKAAILSGDIPKYHIHFGGAELIVTDDPNRPRYETDTFVCSPNADQISWLIYLLKDVYQDELNFMNKYDFYPGLGRSANASISEGRDIFQILDDMIAFSELWYENNFK